MDINRQAALFASKIDLLNAGNYVEKAVHAKNKAKTSYYLNAAKYRLKYAEEHLDKIEQQDLAGSTLELQERVAEVSSSLDKLGHKASLSQFQEEEILPLQGLLGALYVELSHA